MKIWSDVSVLVKLCMVCVVVGFILGLCASGVGDTARFPSPDDPSSTSAGQSSHILGQTLLRE